MFIVCGLMAVIPITYIKYYSKKEHLDEFSSTPWALGGAIYIGGAVLFMLKVPERFSKRTFDRFVSVLLIHSL